MQLINSAISRFLNSVPLLLGLAFVFYLCEIQAPFIYQNYFGVYNPRETLVFAYFAFYSLLCSWVLPAIANKLVFKKP